MLSGDKNATQSVVDFLLMLFNKGEAHEIEPILDEDPTHLPEEEVFETEAHTSPNASHISDTTNSKAEHTSPKRLSQTEQHRGNFKCGSESTHLEPGSSSSTSTPKHSATMQASSPKVPSQGRPQLHPRAATLQANIHFEETLLHAPPSKGI